MSRLFTLAFVVVSLLSFTAIAVQAQTGTIKGKVTDAQTGIALPGATVFLEKTAMGAAADARGEYTIQNVPAGSYTIVGRYVGYQEIRRPVKVSAGETIAVELRLTPSTLSVPPVVVTAIGTEALRERMGTAVSTIQGQSLVLSGAHDVLKDIVAKAPGVFTTEASGDPGAATRIVLRGARSLQNNNQPLIVVDGVPIFNSTLYSGNDVAGTSAESRMVDLNPQDVQSVEIYKGPSAASLWGARAANGVIVITTKPGVFAPGKKINISLRSQVYADDLLRPFPLQTSFGQGFGGKFGFNSSLSWGDRIADRSGGPDSLARPDYPYSTIIKKNSKQTYDHATELFHTPVTWDNGVTVSGGDEWGTFYLDIDRLSQKGIILANQELGRTSVRANVSRRFSENVTARVNASYMNTNSARIQQGSNISGILLGAYRTPPDFNNQPYLVNYVSPSGAVFPNVQRTYRNGEGNPARVAGYDNPFFTIYQVPTSYNTNRLFGSGELSYDPFSWLNITGRAGVDYYTSRGSTTYPVGDASVPTGQLNRSVLSQYQVNADLMARATRDLTENITGSLLLGGHLDHQETDNTGVVATKFILPTAPATFTNALSYFPSEGKTIVRTAALYGELGLDLYQQLFLRLSGRSESASTYGPDVAQTYFFPSASLAWEFT